MFAVAAGTMIPRTGITRSDPQSPMTSPLCTRGTGERPTGRTEAGYMFEIEPNAAFRQQLFGQNRLRKLEDAEITGATRACFGECPSWLAPKPLAEYEIWASLPIPPNIR